MELLGTGFEFSGNCSASGCVSLLRPMTVAPHAIIVMIMMRARMPPLVQKAADDKKYRMDARHWSVVLGSPRVGSVR